MNQIFGNPNEGIHAARFLGMARADLLFTLVAAVIVSMQLGYSVTLTNVLYAFVSLFAIGQLFHLVFGVKTAFITFITRYL